ncbi:hypothetical protein DPMN_128558 [Dreissena polymorpha]|uniref:Uncharacterized protein n=1 Tax=Dreissena polymorpha TaxID=45954 RepID=A0A9D4H459_DREPO|nr:hypothetical protein DPMN_128558 [Dreissena polymorpha]
MCPACLGDCLVPSQTVWESPAGVNALLTPSQTVWESLAGTLKANSGQSNAFLFISRSFFYMYLLSSTPSTRVYGCHSLLPLFPLIFLGHQWPVLFLQQVLGLDNKLYKDIYFFFGPQMALTQNIAAFVFHFLRVITPSDVDGGIGNFPK